MKKYDNKKMQAGFTLVEVIVVAVIVAAMAAVAVPMYLGYVDSSRQNAAANAAGSAASFCGACRSIRGAVVDGTVAAGGGNLQCQVGGTVTSRIDLPGDIIVVHTAPATETSTGVVTGRHVGSPATVDAASFNY